MNRMENIESSENTLKKKRSPNFTSHEKNLLINIVHQFRAIIENKKTNQVFAAEKLKTWKKIEDEFNAASNNCVFRTWKNLKLFYENQKKELRKKKAEETKEKFRTFGGPPTTAVVKDTDEILSSIINEKTIGGLDNPFDGDTYENDLAYDNHSDLMSFELDVSPNEEVNREEDLTSRINRENKNMNVLNTGLEMGNNLSPNMNTENLKRLPSPVSHTTQLSTPAKKLCNLQRRRPLQTIQTVTSSKFAEKYDLLLYKRLILVQKQIESIDNGNRMKTEKHKLELELLKVKINNSK